MAPDLGEKIDALAHEVRALADRHNALETEWRIFKEETKARRSVMVQMITQLLPHLIAALLWIGALYYGFSGPKTPPSAPTRPRLQEAKP